MPAERHLRLAWLDRLPRQCRLPPCRLRQHIFRRGPAIALPRPHRALDAQHLVDAAVDPLIDLLEVLDGESVEWNALRLGELDDPSGDLMGLAERNIGLGHQPVRYVRRSGKT